MLIFCKECNNSISSEAYSCPHCGFPLKKNKQNNDDLADRWFNGCAAFVGKIIIFIVFWGIILYYFGDKILAFILALFN